MDILYSYGGGHALYKIFTAIAHLTQTGSEYYTIFMYPSAMIGLFWAASRAIGNSQFSWFLKSWTLPVFFFTSFFLVPKADLRIVDKVDPTFQADNISGLPLGLTLLTTIGSSFAHGMTDLVNQAFPQKPKGGFAFSARVTEAARTMRIKDPELRQNVKSWADQCIWLPYLKTNIKGKGKSVRQSDDLLSWVAENGHPSLGVYWMENGKKSYKTCKETVPLVRTALNAEMRAGSVDLLRRIFSNDVPVENRGHLLSLVEGGWNKIAKKTKSYAENAQQIMVVNALKEGFDDQREKHGYSRLHPELISLNAARTLEAQTISGWFKGETARNILPLLQAYLIGILGFLFLIVSAFIFVPNGIKLVWMWVKLTISIHLWPLFSEIIDGATHSWGVSQAQSFHAGNGFTIETVSGLADIASGVVGFSQGLQMMVPFLSWGLISGGNYAISQIIGGITSSAESNAARHGSEAVDGNVSLGNHQIGNENLFSYSIAQQSYAGSSNFASNVNLGDRSLTQGVNGQSFVDQKVHGLETNYSSHNAFAKAINQGERDEISNTEGYSRRFGEAVSQSASNILGLVEKHSQGMNLTEGLSDSEQAAINKTLDEIKSDTETLQNQTSLNAQTVVNGALNSSLGKGLLQANLSGSVNVADYEALNKSLSTDAGKRLSKNISDLTQFSRQHSSQIINSVGKDATSQLNHSVSEAQTAANDYSKSATRLQNWQTAKNYSDTNGFNVTANENSQWLNYVSEQKGLNTLDAADWVRDSSHAVEVSALSSQFSELQTSSLRDFINQSEYEITNDDLKGFTGNVGSLEGPGFGRDSLTHTINQQGFKNQGDLQMNHSLMEGEVNSHLSSNANKYNSAAADLKSRMADRTYNLDKQRKKTNLRRAASKAVNDTKRTWG